MRAFRIDDLKMINAWYAARGWPEVGPAQARMKGFLVDDVAAGFLMQTDAGVAYLENMISNPQASARDVSVAIDAITKALFALAADNGFEHVAAFTQMPSIRTRAKRLGMVAHDAPYTLLSRKVP